MRIAHVLDAQKLNICDSDSVFMLYGGGRGGGGGGIRLLFRFFVFGISVMRVSAKIDWRCFGRHMRRILSNAAVASVSAQTSGWRNRSMPSLATLIIYMEKAML
jgi:hypothetical protein